MFFNLVRNLKAVVRLFLLMIVCFPAGENLQGAVEIPDRDVRRDAVVQAVEKVLPSVVNIRTKTRVRNRGYFYDWWRENWAPFTQELPPDESAGSGVIIDEAGYVLTNVHVVEGADEITVHVGEETVQAEKVVGSRRTDVALLKLRTSPGQRFKAAKFAMDDDLLLGETVLALGNPFGLGGSVSRGILSAKSRRTNAEAGEPLEIPDWLQTDAAINPGNSGGPLVNLKGEVVGINVAVLKVGQGIGFAIPVKRVSESLAEIFTPEALKGIWFGLRVKSAMLSAKVSVVEEGSPAEKAGVKVGDQVLMINDQPVRGFLDFNRVLIAAPDNQPVTLTVRRGDERKRMAIKGVHEREVFNEVLNQTRLGVNVRGWTGEGGGELSGLLVKGVERGGPGADAGIEVNMVIQSVEGRRASDVTAIARLLAGRKRGDRVQVQLLIPWRRGPLVGFDRAEARLRIR